MRAACLISSALVGCAFAVATGQALPGSVSSDVRSTIEKAGKALEDGDRQLAIALYNGLLYPNPVKIAVDQSSVERDDQYRALCLALQVWETELSGDFPVVLVDSVARADVVVRFVDAISERSADALGQIKLEKNFRWNQSRNEFTCRGTITIVRSAAGSQLTMPEIRDVAMHELGHLLGLGDAPGIGSLMGPIDRVNPLSRPTASEVEDVRTLRRALREMIRGAQAPGR